MIFRYKDNVKIDVQKVQKRISEILEAGAIIVQGEYLKQVPVNKGNLRGKPGSTTGVKRIKKGNGYIITTDTVSTKGYRYPVALYEGTGRLKGAGDFGYTTGRVRAGDVAKGIGGIRPNKFAKRAKTIAKPKVINFFIKEIRNLI